MSNGCTYPVARASPPPLPLTFPRSVDFPPPPRAAAAAARTSNLCRQEQRKATLRGGSGTHSTSRGADSAETNAVCGGGGVEGGLLDASFCPSSPAAALAAGTNNSATAVAASDPAQRPPRPYETLLAKSLAELDGRRRSHGRNINGGVCGLRGGDGGDGGRGSGGSATRARPHTAGNHYRGGTGKRQLLKSSSATNIKVHSGFLLKWRLVFWVGNF